MKQYIVIAYDIADDRRRNRICDILSGCGQRVNYSVFECFLSKREVERLKGAIGKEMKKGEDIVLYYCLCRDCIEKIERKGSFFEERRVVKAF